MLTPLVRKSNAPLCFLGRFLGPSFVRSLGVSFVRTQSRAGVGAEGPPSPRDPVHSTFNQRKGVVVALFFAFARQGASCRVGRGGRGGPLFQGCVEGYFPSSFHFSCPIHPWGMGIFLLATPLACHASPLRRARFPPWRGREVPPKWRVGDKGGLQPIEISSSDPTFLHAPSQVGEHSRPKSRIW